MGGNLKDRHLLGSPVPRPLWSPSGFRHCVRSDLHDEISIESGADPFQQQDRRHDLASFQPGQVWLRHADPGGEFDL
jgi:hypothetical protein